MSSLLFHYFLSFLLMSYRYSDLTSDDDFPYSCEYSNREIGTFRSMKRFVIDRSHTVPSLSSPSSHTSPTQQKSSPVKPYISSFAPYLIYYQKLASLLLTPRMPPGVIILLACKVAGRTCRWHVC